MDIQSRFGLEQNPFVKNAKEIIFESNELKEALTRLRYLESIKGFGLLTGRPGNGKTTALRIWASSHSLQLTFGVFYIFGNHDICWAQP